ncbi:MAG: AAA family ATPase, partial [candidate division Zixibacteria bacterium]|nr:AAA family ATPase [candidate division Zixibacteria bacterium]
LDEELSSQFEQMEYVEVIPEVQALENAYEAVSDMRPDVLVVELNSSGDPNAKLKWAERVKSEFPDTAIFVSSENNSPDLLMSAMRAGVQEFLRKPVETDRFIEAFERVGRIRLGHDRQRREESGSVMSLFSIKGGVGVTTLSVNIGVAMSRLTGKEAAIVDLDLQLGDVANYLDLTPTYNILDACGDGDSVDETQLQGCMTRHDSNVFVLAEPKGLVDSNTIKESQVDQILRHLKSMYSFVIVDTPHVFDHKTLAAFSNSDYVVLVAVASISSIRATRKSLDFLRSQGYGTEKLKVLINRSSKKDDIKSSEIESALDYPVTWTVPNNYRDVIESINSGIPLAGQKRLSNVGKSIEKLTNEVQNWVHSA